MFIYTSHHSISSIISKPHNHITRFTQYQTVHKQAYQPKVTHHRTFQKNHKTEITHTARHTRIIWPIRVHTRFNTPHTRIIRNPPEHKIACKPSHTRISSPYAYHQSYFPLSKIPYAYQPCHTRITRIIFLFNYSHTRMSILIRSHTQHTSTWFLGQGNYVSYAYSPLGVSPIRVSASFHTRMALFHTRNTRNAQQPAEFVTVQNPFVSTHTSPRFR